MSTYRVAVIGAGHRAGARDQRSPIKGRGVQSHADAYRHITECALVAAADPNTDNLGRLCGLYDIPRKYTDYRSMLAEVKPDILSICTTARPRAEIILAAAEGGVRAVYAEKALCGSMEEADRIVETCTRHGIVFNYGTNRRYDTNYGEVRRVVADGEIGEPTAAIFYGGGLLLHGGSHTFDTLMFLLGDPEVEAVQGGLCAYEEWGEKWLPEGRKFFNRPIYSAVENRFEPDPTLGVNDFTSDPGVDWAKVHDEVPHRENPQSWRKVVARRTGVGRCRQEVTLFLQSGHKPLRCLRFVLRNVGHDALQVGNGLRRKVGQFHAWAGSMLRSSSRANCSSSANTTSPGMESPESMPFSISPFNASRRRSN